MVSGEVATVGGGGGVVAPLTGTIVPGVCGRGLTAANKSLKEKNC